MKVLPFPDKMEIHFEEEDRGHIHFRAAGMKAEIPMGTFVAELETATAADLLRQLLVTFDFVAKMREIQEVLERDHKAEVSNRGLPF